MAKEKTRSITVQGAVVTVAMRNEQDYISLTDMVKRFGDETILYNWLRNRNTVEFLGIWEQLHNPDFKPLEFDRFRAQADLNQFSLSPRKWGQSVLSPARPVAEENGQFRMRVPLIQRWLREKG